MQYPGKLYSSCSKAPGASAQAHPVYKMPRSLAEAHAQAHASTSSGGAVSFISPPLLQPEAAQRHPKLPPKPQDCITPNSLCPSVLAADHFTHRLMPYVSRFIPHAKSHSFDHYTGGIWHYLTNPSRTHPTQSALIMTDPTLRPTPDLAPWTLPRHIEHHH